MVAARALHVIW